MVPYGRLYANKRYNVVLVDTPGHYGDLAQSKSVFSELTDSVAEFMKVLIKEGKLNNKSNRLAYKPICFQMPHIL